MMLRRLKNCRGAAALEFAVLVPVFLLIIFVIIDFGWYFFVQHTLQYATREGAKVGQRSAGSISIINTIKNNASVAVNPDDLDDITFSPVTHPDNNPVGTNSGDSGDYMRIITKYDYNILIPIPGIGDSFNIVAKVNYRNEFWPE